MSKFIQIHILTTYPPSNPNRDDLGRPKSAQVGGVNRLRISSQSIKRAVRTSPVFETALQGNLGSRTKRIGQVVADHLTSIGADIGKANEIAEQIMAAFGKVAKSKDDQLQIEQLAFISPDERKLATDLAERALAGEALPKDKDLAKLVFQHADAAADIAMFGRMLAGSPEYNRDAAVQVSHAITTHKAEIEDDYFTAVDDLKPASEDAGAAHIGEMGFGSGVYYIYAAVDRDLLIENLGGDVDLAVKATQTLLRAFAEATPSGKRNSFAHHGRAEFIRIERGDQQPRSLAAAFFKPVAGNGLLEPSIAALQVTANNFDTVYGALTDEASELNATVPSGTLDDLLGVIARAFDGAA